MNKNPLLNKAAICFLAGMATAGSLSAWSVGEDEQEQGIAPFYGNANREADGPRDATSTGRRIDSLPLNGYPTFR